MKLIVEKAANGYVISKDGYFSAPRVYLDLEDTLEYLRSQLKDSWKAPVVSIADIEGE